VIVGVAMNRKSESNFLVFCRDVQRRGSAERECTGEAVKRETVEVATSIDQTTTLVISPYL